MTSVSKNTFTTQLIQRINAIGSYLCVGLDSRFDRIPDAMKKNRSRADTIVDFNKNIIDVTHEYAACYKMNVAFYAGFGPEGVDALAKTNAYLHKNYPSIPRIADSKRSEMGESVAMVKQEIFDWLGFDCVMVTPWFGFDTVRDFLSDPRHGVCIYVHDSNPSASEFQDLELKDGRRVYEVVTDRVAHVWNTNGNVFVEAGATYPEELKRVREIIGDDMVLLVAGIGPQGGALSSLKGLFGTEGKRLLVNSSRGVIFAGEGKKDYFGGVRQAAIALRDQLREISHV